MASGLHISSVSSQTLPPDTRQALVIGAGLSGSAVAYSLAQRGWSVLVLDQADAVGLGASGLPAGLAAPHVSPDDNVLSRITRAGVQATLQRAQALLHSGTDWALTGVLEHNIAGKRRLPTLPQTLTRTLSQTLTHTLPQTLRPLAAHPDSQVASAAQVNAAGLPAGTPALWHAQAGWIRPRQLVAAQLQTPGVEVRWGQKVARFERRAEQWAVTDAQGDTLGQAPWLVLASAYDSLVLLQALPGVSVPLNPLRGQISFGLMAGLSPAQRQRLPPFPVNGHGSFISGVPTPGGPLGWFIGATFERDCAQSPVREQDHASNQARLATLLPALGSAMNQHFGPEQVQGWAGLRCTLPNRLPAVGPLDPQRLPGLCLSTGMGARGISLSVLCGELTAAWLNQEPLPLPPDLARHLAAERFARA